MTDAPFTDRKMCPQCGHSNRITAKVCTNCGYNFANMMWAQSDPPSGVEGVPLKRCPECGHENRVSAKVCSQCGHRFRVGSSRQKWCPRCGTVNRLEAKVCIHCGHRFRTDFAATGQRGADTPSPLAERGRGGEAHSEITEPPIIQAPEAPIELPTQFDAPPRLPDPPVITPSLNSERGQGGEVNPPPPARHATEDLDGEPAPELSDSEFDAMLRNDRKKDRR